MNRRLEVLEHALGHARVVQALTTLAIAAGLLAPMIVRLSGWAGLVGVLVPLLVLAAGSLWSLRLELETRSISISLLVFIGWCALSIVWTRYPVAALSGVLLLFAFAALGTFVALSRDMSQIVRAFGKVLRALFIASFALELFAGIIIDSPIPALGIQGNLEPGRLGPIRGVFGSTDFMALAAVLGMVSFTVETRMGALRRFEGIAWVVASFAMLVLTKSAVGIAIAAIAVIAFASMEFITRAAPAVRRSRQIAVILTVGITGTIIWITRWPIVELMQGASEALYRYDLWRQVLALFGVGDTTLGLDNSVFGRGFLGRWNTDIAPFNQFNPVQSVQPGDAASAFVDTLFQVGFIGLMFLVLVLLTALTRSWLIASTKRAVVHQWPALVLAVLAASCFAMSNILFEAGWMLLVICAVKASHQMSWRTAILPPQQLGGQRD